MRIMMMILLPLLNLVAYGCGYPLPHINLSPSVLPNEPLTMRRITQDHGRIYSSDDSDSISFFEARPSHPPAVITTFQARLMPTNPAFAPSKAPKTWIIKPSLRPSPAPAPSPIYQGSVTSPSSSPSLKHHHHQHHHRKIPHAVSPSPSTLQGCDQITCLEPLTSTPIGSPCGCVFPMKVELQLGVAPFAVFPLVEELEIEVAAGTYLKQSQVRIMGATADSQDQGRTVVDINLVPLGEKFDNTTAILTSERFWHKKVPINMTLFGDYEVIYIQYPGLPSSPPFEGSVGPSGSNGSHENPIMANFRGKNQKMNARTIAIIALSASVLLLVCFGAVSILLKCKKFGRPSSAVGPAITSSITKRSALNETNLLKTFVAFRMPF